MLRRTQHTGAKVFLLTVSFFPLCISICFIDNLCASVYSTPGYNPSISIAFYVYFYIKYFIFKFHRCMHWSLIISVLNASFSSSEIPLSGLFWVSSRLFYLLYVCVCVCILYFYFTCMSEYLAYMYVCPPCHHVYAVPMEVRKGMDVPEIEVTDGCDVPGGCWVLNWYFLEKNSKFLTLCHLSIPLPFSY